MGYQSENTFTYFQYKKMMTNGCRGGCDKCPLFLLNNGYKIECEEYELEHPDEAIGIVEDWYINHKFYDKTFLEDIQERMPWLKNDKNIISDSCVYDIYTYAEKRKDCSSVDYDCPKCWEQKMEIEPQEKEEDI